MCQVFPSLIEIPSSAHSRVDDLHFCVDHIAPQRIEIFSVLKCLKSPSAFEEDSKNVSLKIVGKSLK